MGNNRGNNFAIVLISTFIVATAIMLIISKLT